MERARERDGLEIARTLGRALPVLTVFPAAVLGLLVAAFAHATGSRDPVLLLCVCIVAITPRLTAGLANAVGRVRGELIEASLALGASRGTALRLALRGDPEVSRAVLATLRTALVDATVTIIALRLVSAPMPAVGVPTPWSAVAQVVLLVVIALVLAAPVGAWSAWSLPRGRSVARTTLRLLGQVPIALLVLALVARAEWSASLGAWALAAFLLGAYAPLALGLDEAARSPTGREAEEALALGASPKQVWLHIVLPSSAQSLRNLAFGCVARLVGEAGVFLLLVGQRMGS